MVSHTCQHASAKAFTELGGDAIEMSVESLLSNLASETVWAQECPPRPGWKDCTYLEPLREVF